MAILSQGSCSGIEWYRDAVDRAVAAVQSGEEDYGSAIRRIMRQAGQSGLRMRPDGTRVVDYESGYSRRLDSAVRMNVLDGVRHLNQSIMEEVGRQFGANGVEISAHMDCAPDHLPYQGGQYSNAEFEDIQDGLGRPFGEWNCRHSWHPIILGLSSPAYTPEQLQEYRDYSTEEITIGERTKTRYEWKQEMRRMETAVRQQKDTANLAKAAGDDTLRRECQGKIVALNEKYTALAQQIGVKPEYDRGFVQGFRDVKIDANSTANQNSLTREKNNSTMSSSQSEMFRKIDSSRSDFKFVSDERFERLTIEARKNGANIIRDDPEWNKHLAKENAAASTIGDTMIFRKDVTVSEVLEETRHFEQNRIGLNADKPHKLRMILNEIDARDYIFEYAAKYQVPRNEIELLKRQYEGLKQQLAEWKDGG